MNRIILSIGFFLIASVLFAQQPLSKGQSQFNAGLGFSGWGIPVYIGFDYGIHPDITVGGELSYRSYNEGILGKNYNHSVIGIIGNGNYHFNRILDIPPPFDFYAGINLGFYSFSSPSNYSGSINSSLGVGLQFGGRYYFTKKIGVNLEIGGGKSVAGGKIGISYKL